ncbi:hypothetical protein ACEXQE_21070 [Herbiconiux sp. P17]|uniref:hypothetical protein n=1 Tax=Herbiconiux wuyangfengii TaxID=3342794 RepID=UPI0035B8C557
MPHTILLHADADTVQDYVLTRSIMRFSRGAPPEEWKFEHREVRLASGPQWHEANAFLFDYTLARIVIAADRRPPHHRPDQATFVDHFLDAIRASAAKSARRLWSARQAERMTAPDSTTVALVSLLLTPPGTEDRAALMHRLPPPYRA